MIHALSYFGGLVDGEGCLTLSKTRNKAITPVFSLASTSQILVLKVRQILDEHDILYHLTHTDREDGSKPFTTVRVAGCKQIDPLLTLISDYVFEKKPQLLILREFIKLRSQYGMNNMQWELTNDMVSSIRSLNKRGI